MPKNSEAKTAVIQKLLTRNVEEAIERPHLEAALRSGKKLRVKLGIDPTSPDLHLGHAVVLGKLKEFQDLGHKAVLIIGDFTAQIGDPSGRTASRKPLTEREVRANLKKYLRQAAKIIDVDRAEIRYNNEWFGKEGAAFAIQLSSAGSIQQVLRRADFRKRLDKNQDITLLETLYPLLQGYDSVRVRADVELGGTDQTFNLLMGRRVQRHFGKPEQDIMTVPLLEGLDGVKKMSKSLGNYIAIDEKPDEAFEKTMRIPDNLIGRYFALATDASEADVAAVEADLKRGTNPKVLKQKLALAIVSRYHGKAKAVKAAERWEKLFSKKDTSGELTELRVPFPTSPSGIVMRSRVVKSASEAWRLIEQGAVKINGEVKKNPRETLVKLKSGDVVKIGKRHFFRIKT
ncbi:MAG: tyrosine--tRNA ligase [Patescibacteria group bacterium]